MMKENICTIPINDIFREKDGCPICRMRHMLEEQYVEYITGSAMMAPDVRVKTNETGFCHRHFSMMIKKQKLPNALLLQTHLDEVRKKMLPKRAAAAPSKGDLERIRRLDGSCYVCDRINADILHLLSTVYRQYGIDEEFRRLYGEQAFLCLNDYALVMEGATKKTVDKAYLAAFYEATNRLTVGYINSLYDDVTKFTTMFDYRNAGGDFGAAKDSIERSVTFLTGEAPREK